MCPLIEQLDKSNALSSVQATRIFDSFNNCRLSKMWYLLSRKVSQRKANRTFGNKVDADFPYVCRTW